MLFVMCALACRCLYHILIHHILILMILPRGCERSVFSLLLNAVLLGCCPRTLTPVVHCDLFPPHHSVTRPLLCSRPPLSLPYDPAI